MVTSCLHSLKRLGFPCELPLLDATAAAAQSRVAVWESRRSGGLHVKTRAAQFRRRIHQSNYLGRCTIWHKWLSAACILQLDAAQSRLRAIAPTKEAVLQHMSGDTSREDVQRRQWQHACYMLLHQPQLRLALLPLPPR